MISSSIFSLSILAFPIFSVIGWNSTGIWDNGVDRTLSPSQHDTEGDAHTQFTGEGKARIDGKGTLVLQGDAPRFRIEDPLFDNVSITIYGLRVAEEENLSYQGFTIAARSQHWSDETCNANTYYAAITYDGIARFEKELFHGHGRNAFYPPLDQKQVKVFDDGVPKEVWIGLKFTIVTNEEDNAVLTLYVDKGEGGFEKVLEHEDSGQWAVDADDVECEGYFPDNKIIQSPGFVFIRNDGLGTAEYKDFKIEEIG
jgi:hypothetical protein